MTLTKPLAELIRDVDRPFWNGNGNLEFGGDLARELAAHPNITIGDLRNALAGTTFIDTGIGLTLGESEVITLGEPRGENDGFSVGVSADFRLIVFLAKAGIAAGLSETDPLRRVLTQYVAPRAGALTVVRFTGAIGAGLSTSNNFRSVGTGLKLGAGTSFHWAYCRPTEDSTPVLAAVERTFARARLPQTDLELVDDFGMQRNELLFTRHLGFFNLGVDASWGYEVSGSKDYAIGAQDLTTKLTVAASATASLSYSLTGAFETIVRRGSSKRFLQLIVRKDHTSAFDIGLGVKVGVALDTATLPDDGLAFVESILGITTPRFLHEAFELAQTEDGFRTKADGFVKAVVSKWVGKGFDEIEPDLGTVLRRIRRVRDEIEGVDDRVIGLYEKHLGNPLTAFIDEVDAAFDRVDAISGAALIDRFAEPGRRRILEELSGHSFSELFIGLEQKRDAVLEDVRHTVEQLRTLITSDVNEEIRGFIEARLEVLGLRSMMTELAAFDTVDELRAGATERLQGLIGRLFDKTWDELDLDQVFDEVQHFAVEFDNVLDRVAETVQKALNAKGRVEVSYAYQRVRDRQNLVDIEFDVSEVEGRRLFDDAVEGDWSTVLRDENLRWVRVNEAAFTDALKKKKTLEVHVFGWNHRSVFSTLDQLESNVETGPNGLVTVFNLRTKGERTTTTNQRVTELSYLLQVAGRVKGAFVDDQVNQQEIDALKTLRLSLNTFTYSIKDELTDAEELDSYLAVGDRLRVLEPGQKARLYQAIRELRASAGYLGGDLGRVELKYIVSFDGETLADALFWNHDEIPVPIWRGATLRSKLEPVSSYEEALGHIYVDRLIASHRISRTRDRLNDVPTLYRNGLFLTLLRKGTGASINLRAGKEYTVLSGSEQIRVTVGRQGAANARVHYFLNKGLVKLLGRFRAAARGGEKMTLQRYRDYTSELVRRLDELGSGEGVGAKAVPIMFLDELVRRYVTRPGADRSGESPETAPRTALLDIAVFEKGNDEPIEHIPING